ncbi:type II toxin-antitoxin system Phd/YefM family antitoxin [Nocardia sp. NPDC058497]|uniref:type II toxin-antitoxin system Phd/YefM family antitoxin n=1 Tax=Nocardia sp. NPDC058497 TaxID=3346529 RepID=UPI00365FB9A6
MSKAMPDERITIRELQRNAADVFDRVRRGQTFVVTRHGETIGRIVPPDPAEEALEQAIASGCSTPQSWTDCPPEAKPPRWFVNPPHRAPGVPAMHSRHCAMRTATGEFLYLDACAVLKLFVEEVGQRFHQSHVQSNNAHELNFRTMDTPEIPWSATDFSHTSTEMHSRWLSLAR